MNQTRSFLLMAWLFVAAMLWMEWGKTPAPAVPPAAETSLPSKEIAGAPAKEIGASAESELASDLAATAATAPTAAALSTREPATITLQNDVLQLTVDLNGGRLTNSKLLTYTVEKKAGSPNVQLFSDGSADYYAADSGLYAVDAAKLQQQVPLHFHTVDGRADYALAPGAATVAVPLESTDAATGVSVQRTLLLRRGSYVLEQQQTIANRGTQQLYPYVGLSRIAPPAPPKHSFMTNPDSFSFVGSAWYSPEEKFRKTPFKKYTDEVPPKEATAGAWIGMLQHHFVSAWVPAAADKQLLQTEQSQLAGQPLYQVRSIDTRGVAPGASASYDSKLWVGPKLQAELAMVHPELPRIVDYGRLTVISQPLFWLLSQLHKLLGNWGWSIIAIVLILKALLYWPSKKQYQSMAKMRAVQPRIEALKERYGDDKQALNVAMFELYKKEKVNPAAGCWPILVQMPIFLGLYWVLVETVELRHAPWIGWIQNLTGPDPYFVLPALNLLVMFLTQRLTPTPGMDPMQKKMMQVMPLVFGVMMAFFPAGLVLYWVTNGALGLLQQWWMLRQYGPKKPGTTATVAR
jgi:YidC/Oxa1 family membrane protein insertase